MGFVFDIKVVPSSGKQKFILDKSGQLKCFLKSPAEAGKANLELIKLLSKKLGLPQEGISILLGSKARKKRLKIDLDIDFDELLNLLRVERQMSI